jgi:hypothetical protein
MSNNYFIEENNIWNWDNDASRHDQDIMIVCDYEGEPYCLEKIETNKYGRFRFTNEQLTKLMNKVSKWQMIVNRPCYVMGRCGENY